MAAISEAHAPALIGNAANSLREAFGQTLSQLADEFPQFVVLDADIAGGTGTHHFRKSHPERFLQFGIAEQNMMAAAGGTRSGRLYSHCDDLCGVLPEGDRTGAPVPRLCPTQRQDCCEVIRASMSDLMAVRPRRWRILPRSAPFPG